ncbi:MAG: hypothetical protein IPP26_10250 [Flavobacteriales bacterium]|nr:hypothetical protein [Flavobacteriales bacterium]
MEGQRTPDAFNDPPMDNKDSDRQYRADVLPEDHMAKYADKIEKETEKAKKKFGVRSTKTVCDEPERAARTGTDQRGGRTDEGRPRANDPKLCAAPHRRQRYFGAP